VPFRADRRSVLQERPRRRLLQLPHILLLTLLLTLLRTHQPLGNRVLRLQLALRRHRRDPALRHQGRGPEYRCVLPRQARLDSRVLLGLSDQRPPLRQVLGRRLRRGLRAFRRKVRHKGRDFQFVPERRRQDSRVRARHKVFVQQHRGKRVPADRARVCRCGQEARHREDFRSGRAVLVNEAGGRVRDPSAARGLEPRAAPGFRRQNRASRFMRANRPRRVGGR